MTTEKRNDTPEYSLGLTVKKSLGSLIKLDNNQLE
jgi:hypothetical protein